MEDCKMVVSPVEKNLCENPEENRQIDSLFGSEVARLDESLVAAAADGGAAVKDGGLGGTDHKTSVVPLLQRDQAMDDVALNVDESEGCEESKEESPDPWDMPTLSDDSLKWSELSLKGKLHRVVVEWLLKAIVLLLLLYIFICSLSFLSSSFRLLGGKAAGKAFSDSELLQNPITGLMIGILATVLLQSSSTSTSIVVTMVASGILEVRPAIPIIMGANIGTSVTNTIVSMAQSSNENEFRRAFGGATVHDMFNWLSVLVLLPLEAATGYLYHLTDAIVASYKLSSQQGGQRDMLKAITKPFTDRVIVLDKKVIEKIAIGQNEYAEKSMIKHWCTYESQPVLKNVTVFFNQSMDNTDGTVSFSMENTTLEKEVNESVPVGQCSFLLHNTGLGDTFIGVILLSVSLTILCLCLVLMVKLLNSILKGKIAVVIKRTLNTDLPGKCSYFTGYIAIAVGAGMTILVQSSSVFTSAMTPLVGIGVIKLERMYPLTLGSNIGTTATGLLAAMAASGDKLESALQIALCHLFFNISGILIFYPIPVMRLPIKLAKVMGNTTARYRWFAIFYLMLMFFFVPGVVFGLSMAGIIPMAIVVGSALVIFGLVIVVNIMQDKCPTKLPKKLRTWEFLPECLRSLDPLDRLLRKLLEIIKKVCPCFLCKKASCRQDKSKEAAISATDDEGVVIVSMLQQAEIEMLTMNLKVESKTDTKLPYSDKDSAYGSAAASVYPTPYPSQAPSRVPSYSVIPSDS